MKKKLRNKYIIMIILIIIALFFIMTVISVKNNKDLNRVEKFIRDTTLISTNFLYTPIRYISDKIELLRNYDKIYKKYQELLENSKSNDYNEAHINDLESQINELKQLLEMEKSIGYEIINSEVLSYNKFDQTLVLNKGESSEIKKDMVVINYNGMIGYISQVSNDTSIVRLLFNDNNFNSISVKIQGNNDIYGILSDYDVKRGVYLLEGIKNSDSISLGSMVVTTGLTKEEPSGILIGYVESIVVDETGLENKVYVKPILESVSFDYVGVVKND